MLDSDYTGPRYLTTKELAARLRCSPGHLANERSRGRGIPYYKLAGHCLYALGDVEEWERENRIERAS